MADESTDRPDLTDADYSIEYLREIPMMVRMIIERTSDDRMVDVLGEINSVERQLGPLRRTAASEVPAGTTGDEWEIEIKREAKRSYNTPGLLHNIGDQMGIDTTLELLVTLMHRGVLRLTWQWSALDKLTKEYNLVLQRARHEIEDDNPDYDYGEYWQDARPKYKPIKEDSNDKS